MLPELSTTACSGCRLSVMSESQTTERAAGGVASPASAPDESPKRRAGAPRGNRNALKHGRHSAAACAERAAARARLLAAIPDPNFHSSRWQALAGGGGSPLSSAFKGNNYLAQGGSPEPAPPNPGPLQPLRPRGAPPGNGNALKHGRRSAKRRALWKAVQGFMRAVRACLAEVDARSRQGRHAEVRAAMVRVPNHRERPPHAA
jgi:hypothetical protein